MFDINTGALFLFLVSKKSIFCFCNLQQFIPFVTMIFQRCSKISKIFLGFLPLLIFLAMLNKAETRHALLDFISKCPLWPLLPSWPFSTPNLTLQTTKALPQFDHYPIETRNAILHAYNVSYQELTKVK